MEADTGMAATRTELYMARLNEDEFRLTPSEGATNEGINEVRAMGPEELEQMLLHDGITDSFTLSALAYARARRQM